MAFSELLHHSIRASFHQGDICFSALTRGRQCAFMALSALLYAQSYPVQSWTKENVDQVLLNGDSIYLLALTKGMIPDVDTLLVTHLPAQITYNGSLWHIDYNDYYQGHFATLTHTELADFSLTTLSDALNKALLISQFAILVLQGYMLAVLKSVDSYYLFDSHSRNPSGLPVENGGTAVMLQFSNKINFFNHVTHLSRTLHVENFEIVPITMTCSTEQIPPIINIISNQNNAMSSKQIQSDTDLTPTITVVSEQNKQKSDKQTQSKTGLAATITVVSIIVST